MNRAVGRRELHKRATRRALREASKQLFAEQGYEATTVREIAHAAHVTERTFYRYFDGKEDLLAEEAFAWIKILHDAIQQRPLKEPPFVAVWRAMVAVATQAAADAGPSRFWMFTDRPRPFALLPQVTPRPLRRFEESVADAILARTRAGRGRTGQTAPTDPRVEFQAQLLSRIAVAALRSAAIRHRQLQGRSGTGSPGITQLLDEAFATLVELARVPDPSTDPNAPTQ